MVLLLSIFLQQIRKIRRFSFICFGCIRERERDSLTSPPTIVVNWLLYIGKFNAFLLFPSKKTPNYKNVKELKGYRASAVMCCGDGECHPLGFLLGLPFALIALLLSLVGVIIWIVGITLSCICPCCICVTVIVEMALALIKAPFSVMKWFTEQIPC